METICVEVWLYGPLARYGGEAARKSHACLHLDLPAGSLMRNLLACLALPTEKRGITFINGNLSAMPGLQPDVDHPLEDGDRVAFFHLKSMWPYQYRDGAALAPNLARAMDTSLVATTRTPVPLRSSSGLSLCESVPSILIAPWEFIVATQNYPPGYLVRILISSRFTSRI